MSGMILGAILAGGQSRRFGSDKAMARLGGRALIEHVIAAVRPQVDDIVVVGRVLPGLVCLADRPMAGLGPLGGLSAALQHAAVQGYDAVLSVSCDTPLLPNDLVQQLEPYAPSHVAGNPLIGFWPAELCDLLDRHLAGTTDRSMRAWARCCDARAVALAATVANVNRPEDLAALQAIEALA